MKKTFLCDCKSHLLEIEYNNVTEWTHTKTKNEHKEKIPELSIAIYEIYNGKSGRKLKKPKLIGDVVIMDGKELDFFMDFLNKITMTYAVRRNK